MKIDKAERVLEDFIERKECPANVKKAIHELMDLELKEFHRLNFARAYLSGVSELSTEDVQVLRQGVM